MGNVLHETFTEPAFEVPSTLIEREMFPAEIHRITLWAQLVALIEPDYLRLWLPGDRLACRWPPGCAYSARNPGDLLSISHMAPLARLTAVRVWRTVRFTY